MPGGSEDEGRGLAPSAAALLGWRLASARGEIEVFFDARDGFTNAVGSGQGGFLAAMLGDALIATLPDGRSAATPEMKVSFLRPRRQA